MKIRTNMILMIYFIIVSLNTLGAYIDKYPQKLTQPNGKVINCFISGDEYYNWMHDKDNYTIIQNSKTHYYCYADYQNGTLIASEYVVGVDDPKKTKLSPGIKHSKDYIIGLRQIEHKGIADSPGLKSSYMTMTDRTLNNIVVYISFADQSEFDAKHATYNSYFNATTAGANSMYNYFREASFQTLSIVSAFYPLNNGTQIISYKNSHIRNYYCPLTAQNDSGYSVSDNGVMMQAREQALLNSALNYIRNQIPTSLNLDTNNDSYVDNICFIVRGSTYYPGSNGQFSLLWPHKSRFLNSSIYLNSKRPRDYNLQIESYVDYLQTGVLCHEMYHTLGGHDIYDLSSSVIDPIGTWDIMGITVNPPPSMNADSKYRDGHWINSVPEILASGHYSLNAITSSTNNCYKIPSSSSSEFFMLEFRKKTGTFEGSIPGTGLLIYRINKNVYYDGNLDGPPYWIYLYRPDGTTTSNGMINSAHFDSNVGRATFHNTSNPSCFLTDGSQGNIYIKNINVSGDVVSFDVRFCDASDISYSNTNLLPPFTNAINQITTSGSVAVTSTDNVTFEAGSQVLLGSGFEVQSGGQFEVNMNCCGNQ